jgi:transcriptional regulator with GAF, ATPase, and Fis domain
MTRHHTTIAEIRARHAREERRLILGALERNRWAMRQTARDLGLRPTALVRLIDSHGLREMYADRMTQRATQTIAARSLGVDLSQK